MVVAGVQVGLQPLKGTSGLLPVDTLNDVSITTAAAAAAIDNPQSFFPVVLTGML